MINIDLTTPLTTYRKMRKIMTILVTEDISKQNYNELIYYLLKNCDVFAFCLPDFGKLVRNVDDQRTVQRLDDGSEFYSYKNKVMPKIEKILSHQLKIYHSECYGTNSYDREREIYVVSIDESIDTSFFESDRLFAWRYPNFPEDLCFYKDGKCFMELISHEQLCFFYSPDDSLLQFFDDRNIEYWEEPCDAILQLDI